MPDDEKKKVKKLVVEETSVLEPEAGQEQEIKSEPGSERAGDPPSLKLREGKAEQELEEPDKESLLIPKEEKKSRPGTVSFFWVIFLALFIIASLVVGGTLIFRAGVEKGRLEAGGVPNELPAPTPAVATPSAEVKREDLKIQVLNGTGKAGVAAIAKEYLEGLGYKDVEAGNADTSDFEETEISIKDSKKDYLTILTGDLSEKYQLSETAKTLSNANDFDAVITIGTSTK